VSKVEKLHTEYMLTKRTSLFLLSYSFHTLFVGVCIVLFFFWLYSCFILVHFLLVVWVSDFLISVNIFLQQPTCIVSISRVVGFMLSSCCLLVHFSHC